MLLVDLFIDLHIVVEVLVGPETQFFFMLLASTIWHRVSL